MPKTRAMKKEFPVMIEGEACVVALRGPPTKTNGRRDEGLCDHEKRILYVTPGPSQRYTAYHEGIHKMFRNMPEAQVRALEKMLYDIDMGFMAMGNPNLAAD